MHCFTRRGQRFALGLKIEGQKARRGHVVGIAGGGSSVSRGGGGVGSVMEMPAWLGGGLSVECEQGKGDRRDSPGCAGLTCSLRLQILCCV